MMIALISSVQPTRIEVAVNGFLLAVSDVAGVPSAAFTARPVAGWDPEALVAVKRAAEAAVSAHFELVREPGEWVGRFRRRQVFVA